MHSEKVICRNDLRAVVEVQNFLQLVNNFFKCLFFTIFSTVSELALNFGVFLLAIFKFANKIIVRSSKHFLTAILLMLSQLGMIVNVF